MATTGLGRLTIDMIMRTAGFEQGMTRAERAVKNTTSKMGGDAKKASSLIKAEFSSVAKYAAGIVGGVSAGSIIKSIIDNTSAMIGEQSQLAAALKSTGEAAGFNRAQMNEMAAALQGASTFSSGEINTAQTALIAFTGIIGNEFVRAQQAAADMSARTGVAITASMETIGRALDVPSKGLAALSRQGFRFTEEQAKLALYLESTGRVAEAQGIILDALEESYGGASKAARETFGGALKGLSNTISGLMTGQEGSLEGARLSIESLNEALSSPEAQKSFASMVSVILQGVELIVKGITSIPWEHTGTAVSVLATLIGARLIVSVGTMAASFAVSTAATIRQQLAMASLAAAISGTSVSMTALSGVAVATGRALLAASGPIGAVLLAGAAVYAMFGDSAKATDQYRASLINIQGPIEDVSKRLVQMTKDQRQAALTAAASAVDANKEAVSKALKKLEDEIAGGVSGMFKGTGPQFEKFILSVQGAIDSGKDIYEVMKAAEKQGFISERATASVVSLSSNLQTAKKELEESEVRAKELSDAVSKIGDSARTAAGGVGELGQKFLDAQAAGVKYLEDITKGNITAGIKTELGRAKALIKAGEMVFSSPGEEAKALAEAALRDRLTASTSSADSAAKKAAAAYKSLIDQLLPMEKITRDYQVDQGMLNAALEKGKITSEQYAIAMANLNMRRDDAVKNLVPEEIKRMQDLARASESGLNTLRIQQERALEGMGKSAQWNELSNALGAVEDRYRGIAEQMAASSKGVSEEDLAILSGYMQKELDIIQEFHDKKMALNDTYTMGVQSGLQQYVDSVGTTADQIQNLMGSALSGVENTLYDLVTTGSANLGDMIRNLGQSVIRMLIQTGLQMAANWALSKLFSTASTAAAAATGTAMATAYAPAAAMASLASFGGNAGPAMAGITSTVGLAEMMAFAGGFDEGGNIGAGKWGIVGEFGPEIVKGPANVTSREDTMRMIRNSGSGGDGDVIVQVYGTTDGSPTVDSDTNEFGQKVIRVMLQDQSSNGPFIRTLQSQYTVKRVPR